MESNKTPTTTDLLGSVEKSKNTPVTMTAEKAVNEHERLIDTLKRPTRSSLKREIKEQESELCGYKNKLKRQFKKSSLIKGAARRLYGKFDPVKELEGQSSMKDWVSGNSGEDAGIRGIRSKLPSPSAGAKLRMTNKLSNRAKTRFNPETKQREFLLHRQMSQHEFEGNVQGSRINHANPKAHTSWTPNLSSITESSGIYPRSTFDSTDSNSYNTVVSAWIPESHIKTMPIQYGETGTYDESSRGTPTSTALKEQEVIVHPGHNSEIYDVLKDTGADKSKWSWSKNFKKSSLIKGAMRRLAPWNKEARQTTANMQEDLGDWQENANRTSRKNLIHQKVDESSRKRTLHKLSSLTPTKVHPDGKRSFLLHRGMDIGEYKRAKIKRPQGLAFQHHEESSWTPNLTISGGFASDAGRDLRIPEGAHVSAWIHEDDIALMPNQHSQNSQSVHYKYEHEVIVKPRGVSPLVRRDEVAKLTGVDKDDKYSHPGGKILDNPDRMINFRQQNQNQFGGDPVARNKYILPEFKRNRFKKSQLQKGVKQRLFPVKGGVDDTKNPNEARMELSRWQTHVIRDSRNKLASNPDISLSPEAKARALHSLHAKTAVRRGKNGEREFLLHRGIGPAERESAIDLPSRITMHSRPVSWTPNIEVAYGFESLESSRHHGKKPGGILSAWIPESAIAHVPKQLGGSTAPGYNRQNKYASEHEVIVHPGEYNLVHDKEVKRLIGQGKRTNAPEAYTADQAINLRANPNIKRKYIAETYAKRRRQFKKSQLLAKSPIIHEQEDDFTYKTLDDNAFNEHFHEMVHEESLPNGLIHHIYQEKNSPDGIIHALSQGDPSQPVSLIAGYIEHKGPYKGYNAHLTATAPEHQGQGHGTLLKELATKRHGRMVSDATLSPAEDRSWQKLKRPDIDVKFGPNIGGNEQVPPEVAAQAVEQPHIATYKPKKLAASEFKKSSIFSK